LTTPRRSRGRALALLFSVLLVGSSAVAEEPTKQECVSANESAQELRDAGKLREARVRLATCILQSCPAPVREDCAKRLDEVDNAMPSLVFEARDESGRDLSAVRVTMDGEPLANNLDGTAIAVDPGRHRFAFEAVGLPIATKTLVLLEGDKRRHERVGLVATPVAPTPDGAGPASAGGSSMDPVGKTSVDRRAQRTIGFALGGAGVVGLAIGSVFAFVSKSTYDQALRSECGPAVGFADGKACSATGYRDVQSARTQASAATGSLIAGAALLGGGAFLYLNARRAGHLAVGASIDAGSAALTARGGW
jgi:hypothetical protein